MTSALSDMLSVTFLNSLTCSSRERFIELLDPGRLCNSIIHNQIHKTEERGCGFRAIFQPELAWMHCVIACNPHNVERLLNLHRKPFLHERGNIVVYILSDLSKMHAKFLECKAKQRC